MGSLVQKVELFRHEIDPIPDERVVRSGPDSAHLLHILFEHASGYALFKVKEFEEISMLQPEVEQSVQDLSKFNSIVKLVGFAPFKSGTNALDNINSISEGLLHEDLRLFLETSLPKPGKKQKILLGISDSKLASAVGEALSVQCQFTGVVPEVIRGIRYHFPNLVKVLTEESSGKAQLGLGHSYSRAKVKFNVNRVDNMVIQSIALLDQLDKDINTFSMRMREWYSYHFPELVKIVNDNYMFARVAKLVGNRKLLTEEKIEELEELTMDSAKAKAIVDASKSSMGMDIADFDLLNIETFANRIIALADYRKSLHEYLASKMSSCAPNLRALIGDQVGARLISHAGSLTNLAKYPASTVQILGAEKALFRAMKTRGNTPKYGLIFNSTFIGRAAAKNKGRISRYLANKCSIASRIDCFADVASSVIGDHLKQQVEDRLKFYETGEKPRKNVDVMAEAVEEATEMAKKITKKEKKKKKKAKLLAEAAMEEDAEPVINGDHETPKQKKKKKKNADVSMETEEIAMETEEAPSSEKKKKKKKKDLDSTLDTTTEEVASAKKKKKKRDLDSTLDTTAEEVSPAKKKKKNLDTSQEVAETESAKKKKKKRSVS